MGNVAGTVPQNRMCAMLKDVDKGLHSQVLSRYTNVPIQEKSRMCAVLKDVDNGLQNQVLLRSTTNEITPKKDKPEGRGRSTVCVKR